MSPGSSACQRSPVMGINSNIQVGERELHVQTEDLGPHQAHIVTQVFVDDGRLLCVARFDYSRHTGDPNLRTSLLKVMRTHHLAVIQRLRRFTGENVVELREALQALGTSLDSIHPASLRAPRSVTPGAGMPLDPAKSPSEPGPGSDHDRRLAALASDEGLQSYRGGDLEQALLCWSRAVQLDPENRAYRANLRRIQGLLGPRSKA